MQYQSDQAAFPAAAQPKSSPKSEDDLFSTVAYTVLFAHHLTAVYLFRGGTWLVLPFVLYIALFIIVLTHNGPFQQDLHARYLFVAAYICGQVVPSDAVQNALLGVQFVYYFVQGLVDTVVVGRERLSLLPKIILYHLVAFYIRTDGEPNLFSLAEPLVPFTIFWLWSLVGLRALLGYSSSLRRVLGKRVLRIYGLWDTLTALCLRSLSALEEAFGSRESRLEEETVQFTYPERLSRYEIRLLVLARRKLGRPPQIQLVRRRLTDLPDFVACSYAWGDHATNHVVGVLTARSLKHLRVTSSLYNLLCREQSFFSAKTLWVDAVCINQNDKIEKATQVAIMRSIFARASRVRAVFDNSLRGASLRAWLHFAEYESRFEASERRLCHFNGDAEAMITASDLHEFFKTEWLQRMWILQEAVVARRLTIRYRTMEIEWDQFVTLLSLVVVDMPPLSITTSGNTARSAQIMELAIQLQRASLVQATRRDWKEGIKVLTLSTLIERSQMSQASEERDRVFALLGMSEIEYRIPLDYSLPLAEIYAVTAFSILREEQSLNFLSWPGLQRPAASKSVNLPSWVVPWRSEDSKPVKPWLSELQRTDFRGDGQFNASLLLFAEKTWTLMVVTRLIGQVATVVPYQELDDTFEDVQEALQRLLRQQWNLLKSTAASDVAAQGLAELRRSFWETLVLGRFDAEDRYVSEDDHHDAFRIFDKYLSVTLGEDTFAENAVPFSGIEDAFASRRGPDHVRKQLNLVSSEIISTLRGRVFGLSSSGQAMLLPADAREGDQLVFPSRSALPFVVRWMPEPEAEAKAQLPSSCRFVGPCLIHGMTSFEGVPDSMRGVGKIVLI